MRIWISLCLLLVACTAETPAPSEELAGAQMGEIAPVSGVALDMAEARAARLSNINYALDFWIPESKTEPVRLHEVLTFDLSDTGADLQLDFRETSDKLQALEINGAAYPIRHEQEHLVLPAGALKTGANRVSIELIAGDTSLNRNPEYLYTLFVPDRARTAFPVFDQPNLKASYDLTLDVPATWRALGNGRVLEAADVAESDSARASRLYKFARSDKLSSYLFSFVAGEFQEITRTIDGREMTMFHRETDQAKVARNADEIFEAHAEALAWLEDYTGIKHPFQKFDFALIPTFQYGGMEHVGAIQYRASVLLLDEAPSDQQRLGRANLIAHEAAHMWFGNLVTMDWFNDVWTKEVFANFMASKIVNPGFPDIDHDLNFLLRSYPPAYRVDRTRGANPIRQALPNLNEAGNLYGAIIYNKAPIMMRQLEFLLGEAAFRDGMREYLATFADANATWPDLIEILDRHSEQDLKAWSEVWVNTAGRPHFRVSDDGLSLVQEDPSGAGRIWPQRFALAGVEPRELDYAASAREPIPGSEGVLFNSDGAGYGLFPVDLDVIADQWDTLSDLQKGAQLINLYEQFLEGSDGLSAADYRAFLIARLGERNELLLDTMLSQLQTVARLSLDAGAARELALEIEPVLAGFMLDETRAVSTRKIYLRSLQYMAQSPDMLGMLTQIWRGETTLEGVTLSARERSDLVALLAIKRPDQADVLLAEHLAALSNPDDRRRFEFIMPALSPDPSVRDAFFGSLAEGETREVEAWVVDALAYLHHPDRIDTTLGYIEGGLALMEDIQATGDIFFPGRWMTQILQNHTDPAAARTVEAFLATRPDYNAQLRLKILQASDLAFRAERVRALANKDQ